MDERGEWAGDAPSAARALEASGLPWCWLDGEAGAPGEPRVSYLGIASEVRVAERGREREFLAGLRAAGAALRDPEHPRIRFRGGWVLALGYEFGVGLLGLEPAPDTAPPGFALRLDAVLAIDHGAGGPGVLGGDAPAVQRLSRILGPVPAPAPARRAAPATDGPTPASVSEQSRQHPRLGEGDGWRRSDREYAAEIEACRAAIRDGEAYVLCLTDTAELQHGADALAVYQRLRAGGIAARGGVIAIADRALVSASPERFLSVHGSRVATHPIKGTRPRGDAPAEDAAFAAQLANDPKERAENLMIVDLMRNDLSRICAPGSVAVEGFLRVESHPHVHQLVSTVSGALTDSADAFDAIAACFPGGSMTGAPKRRAVEILASLEAGPRGLYSGCFGWIDRGGDAELAMTIRSVELRGGGGTAGGPRGGRARVGAGGGITADSHAASEVAEKHLKAAPLIAALQEPSAAGRGRRSGDA
ncbi:anthranilate synthase component I family protein [Leucobacter triazinivorans]|uniref:Anthranilate synthase component I family protein n=1 Tax=Leucobacter triazinivorans TaxID=1784719 RepID=A0A4V0Z1Z1_9MICO|nr:anthranilate synthase component I family protein [Leucobacter triazinivorans]QBE50089.1 anthranilate synthase component I family protein [Leucobacter triazinivorans]